MGDGVCEGGGVVRMGGGEAGVRAWVGCGVCML